MKAAELRGLSVDELEEKVNNLKRDLMQFRFQAKTGKLERQTVIGQTKKDIARIKTVITEKKAEVKA